MREEAVTDADGRIVLVCTGLHEEREGSAMNGAESTYARHNARRECQVQKWH